MRIIGGTHRGRRFQPPTKMPYTRPTTDIAKEGLFNTLQHLIDFEGARTLDIFGGTGSISYELASRGARYQVIVERDKNMSAFIGKTAKELGFDHIRLIKSDVFQYLKNCTEQFDFIFAGPPYALTEIDLIPDIIFEKNLLADDGIFVLEHTPRNDYTKHPHFYKVKNYGTTVFTFFSHEENNPTSQTEYK